jgi:hypothetical protein
VKPRTAKQWSQTAATILTGAPGLFLPISIHAALPFPILIVLKSDEQRYRNGKKDRRQYHVESGTVGEFDTRMLSCFFDGNGAQYLHQTLVL